MFKSDHLGTKLKILTGLSLSSTPLIWIKN